MLMGIEADTDESGQLKIKLYLGTDNVPVKGVYEGRREDLSAGLDKAVAAAFKKRTGLAVQEVSFTPEMEYSAAITSQEGTVYTGKSAASIDEALTAASQGYETEGLNYDKVKISVEKTAEAPYFTLDVAVRSIKKENLVSYHELAIQKLAETYGNRLKTEPDSILYGVAHVSKNYSNDSNLPAGRIPGVDLGDIVKMETSTISLDDALNKANGSKNKRPKKAKTTVYFQASAMVIYGVAAEASELAPRTLVESKSGRPLARATPTAGYEPVALTSASALM